MSAEHFQTILTADIRTQPDGRHVEYAEAGTGEPRGFIAEPDGHGGLKLAFNPEVEHRGRAWASCYLYAEAALKIVAATVDGDPLDQHDSHASKRRHLRDIILSVAEATRLLAKHAACDSYLGEPPEDDRWQAMLDLVQDVVAGGAVMPPAKDIINIRNERHIEVGTLS